jgi:hypothetical protein
MTAMVSVACRGRIEQIGRSGPGCNRGVVEDPGREPGGVGLDLIADPQRVFGNGDVEVVKQRMPGGEPWPDHQGTSLYDLVRI